MSDPPPSDAGRVLRRAVPRLAVSIGIAAVFVWILEREGIPVVPPAAALRRVDPWTVALYVLGLAAVHFLRAWRWTYLLRPIADVPWRKVIAVAWVGFLAIMLLPLRMGELARPYLIRDKGERGERAKIGASAALGTIAIERVLDGVVLSAVLAAMLLTVPRRAGSSDWVPFAGYATLLVFLVALAALCVFLAKRDLARRVFERVGRVASHRVGERLAHVVGGVADGLAALPEPRLLVPFLGYTVLYWGLNGFTMWFLARGCGVPITLPQAMAIMGILGVGILLPSGPGLFGNFQASVSLGLSLFVPRAVVGDAGAAYVFVLYTSQLGWHLLAGMVFLFSEHISVAKMFAPREERS